MRKSDALRAAIVAAFPELEQQPQQLKIWLDKGKVAAVRRPGEREAFEYRYRVNALLLDFAGDADLLFATVILFLAVEQPSIGLAGGDKNSEIDFEAEIMTDTTADVLIGMNLVEAIEKVGTTFVAHQEPMLDDDDLLGGGFTAADGVPAGAE